MPILFAPSASQISDVTLTSPTGYYGSTATFIVSTQGYNNGDTIYYSTTGSGIVQTTGTITVSNYLGDLGKANIPITTIRTTSTTPAITATFYNGSTPVNLSYGVSSALLSLTIPDTFFTATVLLLSPAGPGPTALTDLSGNTSTINVSGTPNVRSLIPFTTPGVSSSMFFNGTTDYLSSTNASSLTFGTGNFTVEFWMYFTGASTAGEYDIIEANPAAGSFQIYISVSSQGLKWGIYGATSFVLAPVGSIPLNQWFHLAISRTGTGANQTFGFINGALTITTQDSNNYTGVGFSIGGRNTGIQFFTGYLSNIRVVKGVAVYTGAFTPPTNPLQTTQSAGTNISAITAGQTSLLLLQAPQAANNNSFLDSASTNTVISTGGTPAQGTFSPFWPYATFFNGGGSNPYLSVLAGSGFGFGTGDFTIEYWIYATSWASGPTVVDLRPPAATLQFSDNYTTGGAPGVYYNGSQQLTSSITIPIKTWTHVAYTRSGTTMSIWVNGVQGATGTKSDDLQATGTPRIGTNNTAVNPLNGYLANLRIIKGQSLYNSTFTPPILTSLLPATTNTTLLTCQGASFGDYSTFTNTVSNINSVFTRPISTTTFLNVPYSTSTNIGSIGFDGTNLVITTSTSGLHSLGSNNFTAECWFYTSNVNSNGQIIGFRTAALAYAPFTLFSAASGGLTLYSSSNGSSWNVVNGATAAVFNYNQWNHLAIARNVNTMTVYLNGTSTYSVSVSAVTFAQTNWPFVIGASGISASDPYTGYVSNARLINGYAAYTYNTPFAPSLTPATSSLTGTSLVVAGNNSGIYDTTGFNNIATFNTASLTTSVVKFGSNSMFFSGNSYLTLTSNTNTNFAVGTGDFTIECWMNFSGNTANEADIFESQTTNFPRILKRNLSSGLSFDFYAGAMASQLFIADASIVLGSWFHLAVSRASGTLKGFINGSQVFSLSDSTSVPVPTAALTIGARSGGANPFNGYISDFRFTKLARYTAAFTTATTYLPLI